MDPIQYLKRTAPKSTQNLSSATTATATSAAVGNVGAVAEIRVGLACYVKWGATGSITVNSGSYDMELQPGQAIPWMIDADSKFVAMVSTASGGTRGSVGIISL